jgi:fluoroacetyl-CoA thioesterase
MKQLFKVGDVKEYRKVVTSRDFASFHGQVVHAVCATFALARDMEWTTRQFVLDIRDDDEEGIGTFVQVEHKAPAFEGDEITFKGYIDEIKGNELVCSVLAHAGGRLIAAGKTGQKILKREKIKLLFQKA